MCSMTSFFATFSKYPSHIFLNLLQTSFSTSSYSSSSAPSSGKAVSSALLVSKGSVARQWSIFASNPQQGRQVLIKTDICFTTEKKTYQVTQCLGDPFPTTATRSIANHTDKCGAQTRRTGRCRVTRLDSSLSRCSGARLASAALFDGASAPPSVVTSAGVNLVEKRRWRAEMT